MIHVCVYTCLCVYEHVHMAVEARCWHQFSFPVFLQLFFESKSLTKLGSYILRKTVQWAPGIHQSVPSWSWNCWWMLGIQTQVLNLAWQELHQLNKLPCPYFIFIYYIYVSVVSTSFLKLSKIPLQLLFPGVRPASEDLYTHTERR